MPRSSVDDSTKVRGDKIFPLTRPPTRSSTCVAIFAGHSATPGDRHKTGAPGPPSWNRQGLLTPDARSRGPDKNPQHGHTEFSIEETKAVDVEPKSAEYFIA